jgi:hypothetical protein
MRRDSTGGGARGEPLQCDLDLPLGVEVDGERATTGVVRAGHLILVTEHAGAVARIELPGGPDLEPGARWLVAERDVAMGGAARCRPGRW